MSDDSDARREFEKHLADAQAGMKRLGALANDESRQIAADMGDPQTPDNRMFWATLFNVVTATRYQINSGSAELRTILDLARTVTPRQRDQWAECKRVTELMFDDMDAGETVGLSDTCLRLKPDDDAADRAVVVAECASFYRVPPAYAPALGDVVAQIMAHVAARGDGTNWNLPQQWACMYSYVAGAIAARALPAADTPA